MAGALFLVGTVLSDLPRNGYLERPGRGGGYKTLTFTAASKPYVPNAWGKTEKTRPR